MKKKFLSLALSCALLLALAGCGTNNETSSGQSDSSPQVQTVTDMTYSITERYYTETGEVETLEVEGLYTGQVVDEIPNGEGTFVSESSDGDIWTYTGQFENGLYNGQGKMTLSAESDDQDENLDFEVGTFIDGLFTPTTYELFNTISSFATADYSISDENRDFMELNSDLFPAVTAEAQSKLSNFVDSSITYPMMTKTLDGLGGKFYHCPNAYVIQIFQTKCMDTMSQKLFVLTPIEMSIIFCTMACCRTYTTRARSSLQQCPYLLPDTKMSVAALQIPL